MSQECLAFSLPNEIRTLDRSSPSLVKALVFSILFHVVILVSMRILSSVTDHDPVQIVPIEVSRLILQSKPKAAQEPQEERPVEAERREPLPNIIPRAKALEKKIREVAKPRVEVTPTTSEHAETGNDEGPVSPLAVPSVEAQPLEQIKPQIPDNLRTSEYKSYVRVKVEIGADGVSVPSLRTSSGNAEIDERVIAALNKWRWRPALVDGRAVSSIRYFKFEFEVK
jgi:TonB family protein